MVPLVMRRYTVTSRLCPMRQARSRACMSVEGFQSGSYSSTLQARQQGQQSRVEKAVTRSHKWQPVLLRCVLHRVLLRTQSKTLS